MENPLAAILPLLTWAVFIGATLLSIAVGAILSYHWRRYTMNPPIASLATLIYAIGTGVLLSILLGAAIAVQVAY